MNRPYFDAIRTQTDFGYEVICHAELGSASILRTKIQTSIPT